MSSLHHDRLPEGGTAPADPVATTATPARRTTRSSTAASQGTARSAVPSQRQGKAAAEGAAPRRPTPCKRPAAVPGPGAGAAGPAETALVVVEGPPPAAPIPAFVVPVPAGVTPLADPEGVVAVAQSRAGVITRRPPTVRRRPAVYVAAALIGALSISGASAAPAEVDTRTMSQSVSVAERLGLQATPPAVADEDATSHLRGLVTSRNARDAERTAAADAQAEADRLATEEAARIAAEAARPKAVHPVEGARLTSGFGARWGTLHAGVDLAAPMRTPERAVMDGVVLEAGPAAGFGLAVYIEHDNGDVTVYGHMDEILVEPGQVVRAGDTIALLGNRGQSSGPHLHFEVHVGGLGGQKVDPLPWLRERGVHI